MSGIKLSIRVWDAPVRLFHWLLVVLVIGLYASQLADAMALHYRLGEITLSLVVFRLLWGIFGSDTARFARFLRPPSAALAHLRDFRRREPDTMIGHNPAGGWMVVILLFLLLIQACTGLFSRADRHSAGPLNHFLAKPASDVVSAIHSFNFYLILAAIIVHLLAIAAYAWFKEQNLVGPMISGRKRLPAATPAPRLGSPFLALALYLVAVAVVAAILYLPPR